MKDASVDVEAARRLLTLARSVLPALARSGGGGLIARSGGRGLVTLARTRSGG